MLHLFKNLDYVSLFRSARLSKRLFVPDEAEAPLSGLQGGRENFESDSAKTNEKHIILWFWFFVNNIILWSLFMIIWYALLDLYFVFWTQVHFVFVFWTQVHFVFVFWTPENFVFVFWTQVGQTEVEKAQEEKIHQSRQSHQRKVKVFKFYSLRVS